MLHFPSSKLVSDNKGITWIPKSLKVFASFGKTAAIPSITTPSGASSPSAQYQGGLRNEYSSKCGCRSHPRVSEAHDLWRLPRINRLHFQISALAATRAYNLRISAPRRRSLCTDTASRGRRGIFSTAMLSRSQVREHTGTYQTVASNAPYGLQCLKNLFEQEDSSSPDKAKLETVLAKDFRDLENGNERSKSREDIIELIMSRRSRYSKYQTDLTRAWCITNSNKTQTVLFESIRFIVLQRDTEWIRIPLSGRLEVRACTVDGKAGGEIVLRKLTMDLSAFWKRKAELESISPISTPTLINSPPSVSPKYELPAPLPDNPRSSLPGLLPSVEGQPPNSQKRNSFVTRVMGLQDRKEKSTVVRTPTPQPYPYCK
jgi:hypothetical protein